MQTRKDAFRFSLIFFSLILCLLFLCFKLALIQVFNFPHLAALADRQHNHFIEIEPVRGTIYDRKMRPLAFNIPVYSVFANPREMKAAAKDRAVAELAPLLSIDPQKMRDMLNKNKFFIWVKRKIPMELSDKIKNLKIQGIGFRKESKRFYPNGSLAAHIIGFAGIDNEGLEGLELNYNHYLKGEAGQTRILQDARQRELMIEKDFFPARDGYDVVLTIDETIQYIAEKALDAAYLRTRSLGATIIVLDIKSGEILALANRPTYNLEDYSKSSPESRTNRAVGYVYEPGSVFKIVTASAALESGIWKESDKIFCENGQYRVGNHILHDHGKHGLLSFVEVIWESSNIGVTKIAQKIGAPLVYKYGRKFRFGMKTNIDLKGEVNGVFKSPAVWSKTSIGAIPIGHEVTVTPIQLVCAIASIGNNGLYMKPHILKYVKDSKNEIVKSTEPEIVDRVISEETAKRVTSILTGVVDNGTAKKAAIPGVKVAGKTGTAQKVIGNSYSADKFYASFFGFAPSDNPQIAAVVVLDEPRGSHFGGTVSAPVFKEVVENTLRYLEMTQ